MEEWNAWASVRVVIRKEEEWRNDDYSEVDSGHDLFSDYSTVIVFLAAFWNWLKPVIKW